MAQFMAEHQGEMEAGGITEDEILAGLRTARVVIEREGEGRAAALIAANTASSDGLDKPMT